MSEELKQDPGFGSSLALLDALGIGPVWVRRELAVEEVQAAHAKGLAQESAAGVPAAPVEARQVITPEPVVAEVKLPVAAPVAQPSVPAARPAPAAWRSPKAREAAGEPPPVAAVDAPAPDFNRMQQARQTGEQLLRFLQDGRPADLLRGMALIPLAFLFDALDGRMGELFGRIRVDAQHRRVDRAGVDGAGMATTISEDEIADTLAINLKGAILTAREGARRMMAQGVTNGRIVLIASITADISLSAASSIAAASSSRSSGVNGSSPKTCVSMK